MAAVTTSNDEEELENLSKFVSDALLNEMVRLLYWRLRNEGFTVLETASPDGTITKSVEILTQHWRQRCVPAYEALMGATNDAAYNNVV